VTFETALQRALARDLPLFGSPEAIRRRYETRYWPASAATCKKCSRRCWQMWWWRVSSAACVFGAIIWGRRGKDENPNHHWPHRRQRHARKVRPGAPRHPGLPAHGWARHDLKELVQAVSGCVPLEMFPTGVRWYTQSVSSDLDSKLPGAACRAAARRGLPPAPASVETDACSYQTRCAGFRWVAAGFIRWR
jgi:hypothetical protein